MVELAPGFCYDHTCALTSIAVCLLVFVGLGAGLYSRGCDSTIHPSCPDYYHLPVTFYSTFVETKTCSR